jgi:hypothetical protein
LRDSREMAKELSIASTGRFHGIGHRSRIQAAEDYSLMMKGDSLHQNHPKSRLSMDLFMDLGEFIKASLGGIRPGKLRSRVKLSENAILFNVPYFIRPHSISMTFRLFKSWCAARNRQKHLGKQTFTLILNAISIQSKRETSVSYFYTEFLDDVTVAQKLLLRLRNLILLGFSSENPEITSINEDVTILDSNEEACEIDQGDEALNNLEEVEFVGEQVGDEIEI